LGERGRPDYMKIHIIEAKESPERQKTKTQIIGKCNYKYIKDKVVHVLK
jgi:GR25 family glycosyltransferase involved in LPS biosynthesis